MSNEEHGHWLPVVEAAEKLGITENELRIRLFSGTVRFRRGDDDVVYVFVDEADSTDAPAAAAAASTPGMAAAPSGPAVRPPPPAGGTDAVISLEAFGEIKSTYEAAVELLRAEMRRTGEQFALELARLQEAHNDEIERLKEAHDQAVDRILTTCERRVDDLQKAHDAEIAYLRQQLADADGDHSMQTELDVLRQQRQELLTLMQALTGKLRPNAQNQAVVGATRVRFTVVPDDEADDEASGPDA